jgi:putative spermidine/putrescine transport system substrate-binding protein
MREIRKMRGTQLTRRETLAGLGAVGFLAGMERSVRAAGGDLVMANWGGDATAAYAAAYAEPIKAATGLALRIDGSGPLEGTIKTQVDSKAVLWDLADAEAYSAMRLGRQGLLEPVGDIAVNPAPQAADAHAVPYSTFSYVIAYDAKRFGDDPPTTWADVWNVEKYPGKRSFYKWMSANLECALLADGVNPDQLYPLDVDRALKKFDELKPHVLTNWGSGAESQQLFRDGEVAIGHLWHSRAILLKKDSGGAIDFTFNQGILDHGVWVVPKGNPAGVEAARRALAVTQEPAVQAKLMQLYKYGPMNPAANALIPEALRGENPSDPANLSRQVIKDNAWYADNYDQALERWLALFG